mmetsp:Transcript_78573/g.199953  ORF Transcript_78573/g.199953 Transcript_78573/m.199953 type:complete len:428 (+) Transcript_78573:252-1535(+)
MSAMAWTTPASRQAWPMSRRSPRPSSKSALRPATRSKDPGGAASNFGSTARKPRPNATTAMASSSRSSVCGVVANASQASSAKSTAPSSLRAHANAAFWQSSEDEEGQWEESRQSGATPSKARKAAQTPRTTSGHRAKRRAAATTGATAAATTATHPAGTPPCREAVTNRTNSPTQLHAFSWTSRAPGCVRIASKTSPSRAGMSASLERSAPTLAYSSSMSSSRMSMIVHRPAWTASAEAMWSRISFETNWSPAIAAAAQNKYCCRRNGASRQWIQPASASRAPHCRRAWRHSTDAKAMRPMASAAFSAANEAAASATAPDDPQVVSEAAAAPAAALEEALSTGVVCRHVSRTSTPRSTLPWRFGGAWVTRLASTEPSATTHCTRKLLPSPDAADSVSSWAMKSNSSASATGSRDSSSWSPTAFHAH